MRHPAIVRSVLLCSTALFFLTGMVGEAGGGGDWEQAMSTLTRIPDIGTFMQIGAAVTPHLTSNGQMLYFTTSMSGTRQLYRLTSQGWPYQLTFFENGIGSFNFSSDEGKIAITAVPGGTERYQIFLIDARTGALTQLTDEPNVRYTVPLFSPDDRKIYYSANLDSPADFYIYEQEIETGARRVVYRNEGWNSVADISEDGSQLLVWHVVSSLNHDVYRVDARTGRAVHLTPHEGNVHYASGLFDKDPETVYLLSDQRSDGIPRLGKVTGTPPTFRWMFPNDPQPWEIESLTISPDYRVLAWVTNEGGWSRLHLRDLEEKRSIPFPDLNGMISEPSLGLDGHIAFSYNSPVQAPDIWTTQLPIDHAWGRARPAVGFQQRTFSSYAGVDPNWFEPPKLIHYESFDGSEIPAFLYLPKGAEGGAIPFVVHVHGGPEGQFRPFFNRHFQYLLLNGYGILAPNVRGSDGYGRPYRDADNYRNRLDSVKDLAWGVKHLLAEGLTTADRVGVKGASYGGYMTLAALTEYPDLFAAGIDQVGIANFETFLANTAAYRRDLRASEYGPLEDSEFLRSISPIHKVDRIRAALFVVHGENDPRVPVGEARQILRALTDRGVPVDSLIFPNEGHGMSRRENRLIYYRRMVEFFDRHLKNGAGS